MIINDFTKRQRITILSATQLEKITNFLVKDFVPKLCSNKWIALRDIYGAQCGNWSNIPLEILYNQYFKKYNDSKKARKEAGKQLGFIVINLLRDLPEKFEIGVGFRTKLYKRIPPIEQSSIDEDEQTDIAKHSSNVSRDELKKLLNGNRKTNLDEIIEFHGKRYKRNNLDIAIIKDLRGYKCQIYEKSIRKEDGSSYVEAAHIIPKCERGSEAPDNILILCPNHHKEFDYGKRDIIRHTKNEIVFKLNDGEEYNISLRIE